MDRGDQAADSGARWRFSRCVATALSMPDQTLTVKVDADTDTDDAVDAIEDVVDAVERLDAALASLHERDISIDLNGTSSLDTNVNSNA